MPQMYRKRDHALILFFSLAGLVFWLNVPGLYAGFFDETGLPPEVIPLHSFANGLEGTGWLLVAIMTGLRRYRAAAWVGYFVVGMWAWDMTTTTYLSNMPVPPYQWAWGPLTVLILLVGVGRLWRRPDIVV